MMSYFDDAAASWDDSPRRVLRASLIAETIVNELSITHQDIILEFGAGTGLLGLSLKVRPAKLVLADESQQMVAEAQSKINGGDFPFAQTHLSTDKQPWPEDDYTVIITMLAMHHVEDVPAMIRQFYRSLTEKGRLAIVDLVSEDGSFHESHKDFTGHKGFETATMQNWLEDTGFIRIKESVCYTIEKETSDGLKKFPLFLMSAAK